MNDSNLEVYLDPINYDRESSIFESDGAIVLDIASQLNSRILEFGCGTGRVTIPLTRRWQEYNETMKAQPIKFILRYVIPRDGGITFL